MNQYEPYHSLVATHRSNQQGFATDAANLQPDLPNSMRLDHWGAYRPRPSAKKHVVPRRWAKRPNNRKITSRWCPNVYVLRKSQHCAIHKYTQGEECLKSKKIENHTNKEISGFAFFVGVVRVFAGLQAFVCLSSLGSKSCRTAQTKS